MKCFIHILILFSFFVSSNVLEAENSKIQHLETLKQQMNNVVLPSKKIKAYALELLHESRTQHNNSYMADALIRLACFYRTSNADSMHYVISLATPILEKENRYDDMVSIKGLYIYSIIVAGSRDSVTQEINGLRSFGKKYHNQFAYDVSDQMLAFLYWNIGPRAQSREILANLIASQEKRNAPLIERPDVLMQAINTVESPEERALYLTKLKNLIYEMKKNKITFFNRTYPFKGNIHSLGSLSLTYYKMAALMHYDYPNASDMLEDLKQLDPIINEYHQDELVSKYLWMLYNYKVRNYNPALILADTLITAYKKTHNISNLLTMYETKSRILSDMGKFKESLELYRNYTAIKDSVNDAKFYSQLADLQSKLDINKLEMRNKEVQIVAQREQSHVKMLTWGSISLFIIIVLLVITVIVYKRNTRLAITAKQIAEDEAEKRSSFLANMNHEIRTPLNVIDGFSQLIVESNDPNERKYFSDIIHENNMLMQRLVADVLDISKLESNKLQLKETSFEMIPLMKELYESTRIRMPEGVILSLSDCEPATIISDRVRLIQILNNLLNNAIKHTQHGYISFGYTLHKDTIRFDVKDTGEGIPADKLDSIFTRFVQLNDWTAGVGLGLAISRALVEQMHGAIYVNSKVDEGSDFYFILPLHSIDHSK